MAEKVQSQLAPNYFIDRLIKRYDNLFVVSQRLSEVIMFINKEYKQRNELCQLFVLLFGIFQPDMLNETNFPLLAQLYSQMVRRGGAEVGKILANQVYAEIAEVETWVSSVFASHTFFGLISQRVNEFTSLHSKLVRSSYANQLLQSQFSKPQGIQQIKFGTQKLVAHLVSREPNIFLLASELADSCRQRDPENTGLVQYTQFLEILAQNYGVSIQDENLFFQLGDFKKNLEDFDYRRFITKIKSDHLPDQFNEGRVQVVSVLHFLAKLLVDVQKS